MKMTLAIIFAALSIAYAQETPPPAPTVATVSLVWDPTPPPDDARVGGYKLYYSTDATMPANATTVLDAGNNPQITVPDLPYGKTYYFAVTAYDKLGIESKKSEILAVPIPLPAPKSLRVVTIEVSSNLKDWKPLAFVPVAEEDMPIFVRAKPSEIPLPTGSENQTQNK